jgi:hypothetical protein
MGCLKGFIQRRKVGALTAYIDPGYENQQHFPYKYGYIAAKYSIHDSTANDRRHTKKYQNTQLSAYTHLYVPPSTFMAKIQRNYTVDYHRELVLNISNNALLSKANFS